MVAPRGGAARRRRGATIRAWPRRVRFTVGGGPKRRLHSDWYYAPADAAWWTRVGGWLERYDRIRWAFSATEAVDFFPLTEHSVDDRSWIAWQWRQLHDGKERGVVQVFRQFACPVSHATLPIYALDPAKHYCKQPANPDSLLSLKCCCPAEKCFLQA